MFLSSLINIIIGRGCTRLLQICLGGHQSMVRPRNTIKDIYSFSIGVKIISAFSYQSFRSTEGIRRRARVELARSTRSGRFNQGVGRWSVSEVRPRWGLLKRAANFPGWLYQAPGFRQWFTPAQRLLSPRNARWVRQNASVSFLTLRHPRGMLMATKFCRLKSSGEGLSLSMQHNK